MTTDHEPRWRALAEATFEGVALLDRGRIVECNDVLLRVLGGTREQVVGHLATDFVDPAHRQRVVDAIAEGREAAYEVVGCKLDGTLIPVEIRGRPITLDGRPMRVTALRDLSDLRRTETRYRRLFEAAGDGIMIMDEQARPLEVNARLCEILGYTRDEVLSMSPEQGIADLGDNPMQLARLRDQDRYVIERELRHADGHVVEVEVSVTRLGPGEILAVIRDISDRVRALAEEVELRRRLAQAQRMESLGRLAGGVAHDFNNLLTVIIANTDMLERTGHVSSHLGEIAVASQRAADLTRQLLSFSRPAVIRPTTIDPNEKVAEAVSLLRRLLGEDVLLDVELGEGIGEIHADAGQFTQVVLNLAVNARDAMPEGGSLSIRTASDSVEGRPHLRLTVSDSGGGIEQHLRERIFEPFFTSKDPGEGTGLGLATVFSIVTQWDGTVRVDDAPGGGTTFEVRWPLREGPAPEPPASPLPVPHRSLRILVVEDDEAVRRVVQRALVGGGHEVLVVGSPEEALASGREFAKDFDLLLTDVIMPGMDGPTLAAELGAANVVYMSGYPGEALDDRGVQVDPSWFLEKPFTGATLTDVIARAMAGVG